VIGRQSKLACKRALDVVISGMALLLLAPGIALLAVVVRFTMGSPVFFRQLRPGLGGVPFEIVKFRTMSQGRDASGKLLADAERLTSVGRFLRRTSLDELPEIVNVLQGHMSLVGPRPLLMDYVERYTPEQARRMEMLPGITGWAQINGRNTLTWEDKFALDLWYIDNWTLRLDFRIAMATFRQVVTGRGYSHVGHATMPEFHGGGDEE